ncbi:MAG: hypothetical protein ABIM60_00780 [candidate division WOR-3 bacterium]
MLLFLKTKFGFAYAYKSLTSENAKDSIRKYLSERFKEDYEEHFVGVLVILLSQKNSILPPKSLNNFSPSLFNNLYQSEMLGILQFIAKWLKNIIKLIKL